MVRERRRSRLRRGVQVSEGQIRAAYTAGRNRGQSRAETVRDMAAVIQGQVDCGIGYARPSENIRGLPDRLGAIMMTSRLFIVLPLLLAGCQVQGNASVAGGDEAGSAAIERKAEPLAVPPEDPCLDAANANPEKCAETDANIDQFVGTWKITRVHVNPEGVQAFVENDKAIVGSIFSIAASEIKWTVKASAGFTSDDVCKQPSAGPLPAIVKKEEGSALTAALKPFAISASARGPIHRFGCVGGGTWGPGEVGVTGLFIPIGTKQMVLKWYDGATLLAERSGA